MKRVFKMGELRDKIIISDADFQSIETHNTYDHYGQSVGYYEAQAGVEILTDRAAAVIEDVDFSEFKNPAQLHIGDSFYVTDENFYKVIHDDELEEGIDYRIFSPEVIAYNYWDGRNWKTVVLETDFGYPDLEEVEEDLSKEILDAYETKELSHEGFGSRTYKSGRFTFVETAFASDWYTAEVFIED